MRAIFLPRWSGGLTTADVQTMLLSGADTVYLACPWQDIEKSVAVIPPGMAYVLQVSGLTITDKGESLPGGAEWFAAKAVVAKLHATDKRLQGLGIFHESGAAAVGAKDYGNDLVAWCQSIKLEPFILFDNPAGAAFLDVGSPTAIRDYFGSRCSIMAEVRCNLWQGETKGWWLKDAAARTAHVKSRIAAITTGRKVRKLDGLMFQASGLDAAHFISTPWTTPQPPKSEIIEVLKAMGATWRNRMCIWTGVTGDDGWVGLDTNPELREVLRKAWTPWAFTTSQY